MDDISLVLNPPRIVKQRTSKPIRITRSPSRVWPLAAIDGRTPVMLDATHPGQRGIELAYPRLAPDDAIESCLLRSPNGTGTHVMPAMTTALAIDDGVIAFAGRLGEGFGMIIDHGNGWASHYANLQAIAAIRTDLHRPREQHVRAGDVIGYVGAPTPGAFKRLYFELWQSDRSRCFVPVDPRPHLAGSKLIEHHDEFTPAPPIARRKAA